MDAAEFFRCVVKPNYDAFDQRRHDYRLAWNAAASMNTVAEYVALHRSGYVQMKEKKLNDDANRIRDYFPPLKELNEEVTKRKHVRRLRGTNVNFPVSATLSSTSYLPDVPSTWKKLADVVDQAFPTVSKFPELN